MLKSATPLAPREDLNHVMVDVGKGASNWSMAHQDRARQHL